MSSQETRTKNKAKYEREFQERQAEFHRRATLTMWERIEESDASNDVKEILHRLADKLDV